MSCAFRAKRSIPGLSHYCFWTWIRLRKAGVLVCQCLAFGVNRHFQRRIKNVQIKYILLDWIEETDIILSPTLRTNGKIECGLNISYHGIIVHFLRCNSSFVALQETVLTLRRCILKCLRAKNHDVCSLPANGSTDTHKDKANMGKCYCWI